MSIVCIGWGSLVWNPDTLPIQHQWHADGPSLPVEFTRESAGSRMTIVVTPGVPAIPVLWVRLDVSTIDDAIRALAAREGIRTARRSVGYWTPTVGSRRPETGMVSLWARERQLHGVVWTALEPGFRGRRGTVPSADEVVDHLRRLPPGPSDQAELYVRNAPIQIATQYRGRIEQELGWLPSEIARSVSAA